MPSIIIHALTYLAGRDLIDSKVDNGHPLRLVGNNNRNFIAPSVQSLSFINHCAPRILGRTTIPSYMKSTATLKTTRFALRPLPWFEFSDGEFQRIFRDFSVTTKLTYKLLLLYLEHAPAVVFMSSLSFVPAAEIDMLDENGPESGGHAVRISSPDAVSGEGTIPAQCIGQLDELISSLIETKLPHLQDLFITSSSRHLFTFNQLPIKNASSLRRLSLTTGNNGEVAVGPETLTCIRQHYGAQLRVLELQIDTKTVTADDLCQLVASTPLLDVLAVHSQVSYNNSSKRALATPTFLDYAPAGLSHLLLDGFHFGLDADGGQSATSAAAALSRYLVKATRLSTLELAHVKGISQAFRHFFAVATEQQQDPQTQAALPLLIISKSLQNLRFWICSEVRNLGFLAFFPSLQTLAIERAQATATAPDLSREFLDLYNSNKLPPHLTTLILNGSKVPCLDFIAGLPNLRHLDCEGVGLRILDTDDPLLFLSHQHSLRFLDLSDNRNIQQGALSNWKPTPALRDSLQHLDLRSSPLLPADTDFLQSFGARCALCSLVLEVADIVEYGVIAQNDTTVRCGNANDESLILRVLRNINCVASGLQRLDVGGVPLLGHLSEITTLSRDLEMLEFSLAGVRDADLMFLIERCAGSLRNLILYGGVPKVGNAVSDVSLSTLRLVAEKCTLLHRVEISGFWKLEQRAAEEVEGADGKEALRQFVRSYPQCAFSKLEP